MRVPGGAVAGLPALLLAACGGGGDGGAGPPPAADPFAAIDERAAMVFSEEAPGSIPGMALHIAGRDGEVLFGRTYGNFDPGQRVAVASASKLITALVLLRLAGQGFLELESTTAEVLGWSGETGAITLEQLLSFTSGLPPGADCIRSAAVTLAACVAEIATLAPLAAPGQRFDYGSTHLHVAARMAEVVTGDSWNAIFATQLGTPLGLSEEARYYTFPRTRLGEANPLAAGGLVVTLEEYTRLLALVLNGGRHQGNPLIPSALIDRIFVNPFPDAELGSEPELVEVRGYRYGLGAWLECDTPASGCAIASSPGWFGWTPWVDRERGYLAILAMEDEAAVPTGATTFSVGLSDELKPLIEVALAVP